MTTKRRKCLALIKKLPVLLEECRNSFAELSAGLHTEKGLVLPEAVRAMRLVTRGLFLDMMKVIDEVGVLAGSPRERGRPRLPIDEQEVLEQLRSMTQEEVAEAQVVSRRTIARIAKKDADRRKAADQKLRSQEELLHAIFGHDDGAPLEPDEEGYDPLNASTLHDGRRGMADRRAFPRPKR
jgi:hypothetical protein